MNARDNLKPKSIRVAILTALSDGAITTIDDLQLRMDENRTKIANNVYPAFTEGLIKRLRDDVTGSAAYQITTKGRDYLEKYASGKTEAPADVVDTENPVIRNFQTTETDDQKAVITPGVKPVSQLHESIDEAHKKAVMAWEISMMAAIGEDGIKDVVKAIDKIKQERDSARLELAAIRSAIKADEEESTLDEVKRIAYQLSIAAENNGIDPVGYILQRPKKPLLRFTKAISAETRAMAFARGGQRAQVFALTLVGTAVPGSEWKAV